jgi:hypothetical protein
MSMTRSVSRAVPWSRRAAGFALASVAALAVLACAAPGPAAAATPGRRAGGSHAARPRVPETELRFTDVPRDHWAIHHIRRAVGSGLMQGYEGRFLGSRNVDRYQMAQVLSRLLDRMSGFSAGEADGSGGPASEIFLQIADEVAAINVAQSTLEEKVVQLRYDLEALRNGEAGPGHGPRRVTPDEWDERLRTQAPLAFAALAIFGSGGFLRNFK